VAETWVASCTYIDKIISTEIPDEQVDPGLQKIVIKNMIHSPRGTFNPNSPCMADGECSKRYPRTLVAKTITGKDGYSLFCR